MILIIFDMRLLPRNMMLVWPLGVVQYFEFSTPNHRSMINTSFLCVEACNLTFVFVRRSMLERYELPDLPGFPILILWH